MISIEIKLFHLFICDLRGSLLKSLSFIPAYRRDIDRIFKLNI
jgi:hypothetical protein